MAEEKKSLEMRVAELEDKLQSVQISEEEMKAYYKVAGMMGGAATPAAPASAPIQCISNCIVQPCIVQQCIIHQCTIRPCTIRPCTIRPCTIQCINECGGGCAPGGGGFGGGGFDTLGG